MGKNYILLNVVLNVAGEIRHKNVQYENITFLLRFAKD